METSLLKLLQKEQEVVQDLNEWEINYNYYLTTSDFIINRDIFLDWYKIRIDMAHNNLPKIRGNIAEGLTEYLNYK